MNFGSTRIFMVILAIGLSLSGCTFSRFTNLTPSQLPRDSSGSYPVEMVWESNNRTIVYDSVRAYAVVGDNFYPMNRTLVVKDRWEAIIPAPPAADYLNFYFKVDYKYKAVPYFKSNSDLSEPFVLQIVDNFQTLPVDEVILPVE